MRKRVAVTGVGMVTPLGIGKDQFAGALFSGASGIGPIHGFDPGRLPVSLAAQVSAFTPVQFITPATLRRMDRLSQMAAASARMALQDAGITVDQANRDDIGIVFGTCFGGTDVAARFGKVIFAESPRFANPILVPNTVMNAPAGHAAVELGVRGINATVNHREVSAEGALIYAADCIAAGRADVLLAGGGDVLSEFGLEVLSHFKMLSPQDGKKEAARPFDTRRNGAVIGEAFGVLCLEEAARARARGASIYCEIAGWCMNGAPAAPNAWPTDPAGPVLAMTRALAAAGIPAGKIDAVCAGANGGLRLDALEAAALRQVFGHGPWITAVKGALGECFASGGVRAAAMALALQSGRLAPVLGLASPLARMKFVRSPLENVNLGHVLIDGLAAGGTFAAIVMKQTEM